MAERLRVFLDSNVLFSATISENGAPGQIFALADEYPEDIALTISQYVFDEARDNLAKKGFLPNHLDRFLSLVDGVEYISPPPQEIVSPAKSLLSDEKDAPILAGGICANANILVTGNRKHFSHLYGREFAGCTILSTNDTLERIIEALEED